MIVPKYSIIKKSTKVKWWPEIRFVFSDLIIFEDNTLTDFVSTDPMKNTYYALYWFSILKNYLQLFHLCVSETSSSFHIRTEQWNTIKAGQCDLSQKNLPLPIIQSGKMSMKKKSSSCHRNDLKWLNSWNRILSWLVFHILQL